MARQWHRLPAAKSRPCTGGRGSAGCSPCSWCTPESAAGLTGAAILTKDVGGLAATDDVTATIIDQLEPAPAGYADGDP